MDKQISSSPYICTHLHIVSLGGGLKLNPELRMVGPGIDD